MNEKEVYKKAVSTWGKNIQIYVATEEMGELIQALSKYLRSNYLRSEKDNEYCLTDNIIEEIVDVEIMLGQLKEIFDPTGEMSEKFFEAKLKRLENKLNE